MKLYLIGSLRNPAVPVLAQELRALGFDVFDDWYAAGPEADDYWQRYEQARGHSYAEALHGFAAGHVFNFDLHHLQLADLGVLVLPAGRSGHIELGFLAGQGKRTYILYDEEPTRWDVMYRFATAVCFDKQLLLTELAQVLLTSVGEKKEPPTPSVESGARVAVVVGGAGLAWPAHVDGLD